MQTRNGLPRRDVIGCGLASLAVAGAAWGEPPAGFEPLPAQVRIKDRQLTTAVHINGRGPFRFVVDTGADHSVIADDVAKALRLPQEREMMVQGIIRALPAPGVPVADLRFGSLARSGLHVPVLPRTLLKADGFLGLDAIGNGRVVFDFKRRILRVVDSVSSSFIEHTGNETRIAAPGDEGHLRSVACRVDGVLTSAFLDSGAEVSVGNAALHRALMNIGPGHQGVRDIELTGITGGSRTGTVAKVETILFGNLEFTGCEIAIADLDIFKIWGLADQPALLIGLNFLREFDTVVVDYGRKEFRLKLAANPSWVAKKQA
jgi:predicted aspartyl protease